jgi:hypothetical protein
LLVALAVLCGGLLVVPLLPGQGMVGPSTTSVVRGETSSVGGENCPGGSGYLSAFRLFEPNPTGTAASGTNVTIQYHLEVLNYVSSDGNITMYTPTIFAKLPISPGGNLTITFPATSYPIPSSGWSNYTYTTQVHKLSSQVTFSTKHASLTTELLATQSSAPYGLNLSLQWRWIIGSGPTAQIGPWGPVLKGLLPVGRVTVTPQHPSGSTLVLGTKWNATINGSTSGINFSIELENGSTSFPRGVTDFTAPLGNDTPFNASLTLFYTRPNVTFRGNILVHVHEICRGLLSNTLVKGVYASSTTLQLKSNLKACPYILYNGTNYSSGAWATVAPSAAWDPLQAPTCAGHTFNGWSETGPIIVKAVSSQSTTLQVTYRGGVTADWT